VSLKDENPVGTAFKFLRISRPERSKLALALEGRAHIPHLRNGCKCPLRPQYTRKSVERKPVCQDVFECNLEVKQALEPPSSLEAPSIGVVLISLRLCQPEADDE
jgi:hypothetical protein